MKSDINSSRTDTVAEDKSAHDTIAGPPAVPGASRPRAAFWATAAATFFGVGRLKPGPGTWASIATVIIWALLDGLLPVPVRFPISIAVAIAVVLIGGGIATDVVTKVCARIAMPRQVYALVRQIRSGTWKAPDAGLRDPRPK